MFNKAIFKKTVMASAVALMASGAYAVDLDAAAPGSASFASENIISATGTDLVNAAGILNVTVDAGFSISDSTSRYMRFEITGGVFQAALTSLSLVVADSGAGALEVLSSGGAAGGTTAVFEVTASGTNTVGITSDAVLTLPNITVTGSDAVTVSYKLYDNATDAVNETGATLSSKSGTVLSFAAGTSAASTSVTTDKIEVAGGSKAFVTPTANGIVGTGAVAGLTNIIGNLTLSDTAGNQFNIAGAADVTVTTSRTASTLTITGDFTATQDLTSNAPDGTYTVGNVFIDTSDLTCNSADIPATTLTGTTATFAIPNAAVAATAGAVCIIVNGVSLISEGEYTAVYASTSAATFAVADTSVTLGELSKNGSTTDLDLLLTPGGVYKNFIRVTNKSTVAGDVFITLWNDSGDSATLDLGTIAGMSSSELSGGASTPLLAIQDVYDAAVAADATFDSGTGKLRARIEGEFSSIEAQALTVAIDGNSFSAF